MEQREEPVAVQASPLPTGNFVLSAWGGLLLTAQPRSSEGRGQWGDNRNSNLMQSPHGMHMCKDSFNIYQLGKMRLTRSASCQRKQRLGTEQVKLILGYAMSLKPGLDKKQQNKNLNNNAVIVHYC